MNISAVVLGVLMNVYINGGKSLLQTFTNVPAVALGVLDATLAMPFICCVPSMGPVFVFECVHVHFKCASMYLCVQVVCICIFKYIHTNISHVCMLMIMHVCIYIYIYIYIYMNMQNFDLK